jgi:hypothetical protein
VEFVACRGEKISAYKTGIVNMFFGVSLKEIYQLHCTTNIFVCFLYVLYGALRKAL